MSFDVLAMASATRHAAPLSAHPVAVPAWAGACLPGGVWLAGRPARRVDRLARNLAGRRVPRSNRPACSDPGPTPYWRLPTVFWLDASDSALHAVCWGGLVLSVALLVGLLPGVCTHSSGLFICRSSWPDRYFWAISGTRCCSKRACWRCSWPPGARARAAPNDQPWWFTIWLVRWLAFRLMFLSGVVKLASHDPTWRDWTALEIHYQTQPLPTWTSWYIHQMPAWFHALSVGFMFYAELVAPFFVFGPRPIRRIGFASLVCLQLLIAATGNYGFFNLLAIVICVCMLDDRDWEWLIALVWSRRSQPAEEHECRR